MLNQYNTLEEKKQESKNLKVFKYLKVLKVLNSAEKDSWNLINPWPLNESHAIGEIHAWRATTSKVFDVLKNLENYYKGRNIYPSQQTIGRIAGLHRVTVNKEIKYLEERGFIAKLYRGAHRPCWYKTSSFFKRADIIHHLVRKLRFFFYLSVNLLLPQILDTTTLQTNDLYLYKIAKAKIYRSPICKEAKTVFKPQLEVNKRLTSLAFKLTFEQEQKLSAYPDSVLAAAIQKLSKSKPKDPANLLFWFCNQLNDNPNFIPLARINNSRAKIDHKKPLNDRGESQSTTSVMGKLPFLSNRIKDYNAEKMIKILQGILNNPFALNLHIDRHKITKEQAIFSVEEQIRQLSLDSSLKQ